MPSMSTVRERRLGVHPLVNKIVVPDVLPRLVFILLWGAIIECDHLTDILHELEAGFCTVVCERLLR